MHSLKSLLALVVVGSTLSFAQPQGELVIRTRDGKTRLGRILSETSKGYLLTGPDGTQVVEFKNIVDLRQVASAEVAPTPTPPPPMPPPVVAVAPVVEATPPPPERLAAPSVAEVISAEPSLLKPPREGFHFGLGAGAMVLPAGALAQVQARPVYRISANFGTIGFWGDALIAFGLDNLFQFNVTDVYSFGAGVQVGLTAGTHAFLHVDPIIQPVIIKLGDRGQHQLSLTLSIALLSTYEWNGNSFTGMPQAYLGYSFLF
jgi:hypothetical protein